MQAPTTATALAPSYTLGAMQIAPLGVGTWAWGDKSTWGYGTDHGREDAEAAYRTSIAAGLTLFDTAEIYGSGESERLVGDFARRLDDRAYVATKFAPVPWRLVASSLKGALDRSLKRLGRPYVDLYQIHWPYTLLSVESLMDALADVVADGKARAVGVSNYSAEQMRRAHERLRTRGVALASNQVHYSLLKRSPEVNGVRDACRELGVTLIAYSPLAMGLLTGKYTPENRPSGTRRFGGLFSDKNVRAAQPVIALLHEIGTGHNGRTPAQVALNWLIHQGGVVPIPGAKNARQAGDNAGALGWGLSDDEALAIDRATVDWRR